MTLKRTASDLEAGLGAFAQEFDRVVAVVDKRDQQVAWLIHECAYLAELRRAHPVQLLLQDRRVDAGKEQLFLSQPSEVEEVDVYLEAVCTAPCEDVLLEYVKAWFFNVDDDIDR